MSDVHVIHEPHGTITVPARVLRQIVVRAAEGADGARTRRPRRGVAVSVEDGRAHVALEVGVRYGAALPAVAEDVQRRVAEALRAICGLEPAAVDVSVEEITS
jgi:uncharacterized alkaline shock family protein YloU